MHDYEYEYEYEHDLGRTQREFEFALHELQPEYFEIPGEAGSFGETEVANVPHEASSYQASYRHPSQAAEEFEFEMAAELLEVTTEQELDHFLGDIFKKVGGFVSNAVKSPVFKALGGVLKPIAKAVLPQATKALAQTIGGPSGDVIASNLASAVGNIFGLELEGLSGEDREFEMAKGIVRLASGAAEQVKNMDYRPGQDPHHAAKMAITRAARRHHGARGSATPENIDLTIDALQPPRLQPARPQTPIVQPPHPQAAIMQPPHPQAATVQHPHSQVAGPHVTTDGSTYPFAITERAGAAYQTAPLVSNAALPYEPIPAGARRHGTWFRRGRRIILIGV